MRETNYKDLTQTKERKKFIWLSFMLILLTAICLCLTTFIYAATQQNMGSHVHMHYMPTDDFIYSQNTDGTYTVTGLKYGTMKDVVIPSEYLGAAVTAIAANAFDGNTTMETLTIPETITSIGKFAFRSTSNLTEINYNVTTDSTSIISSSPFPYAGQTSKGITVNFGANVVRVPDNLFALGTSSFAPNITKVNFKGNHVKIIGASAFAYISSLITITLPDSVTSIGNNAFRNCSGLARVIFGSKLTSIGSNTFYGCSKLAEVFIESQTVCSNLATWEGTSSTKAYLTDYARRVKAKYEITDYSSLGLTSKGLQSDGYYLYTK